MELHGTLASWNDGKGFGFIRPERGGEAVFVHASAMHGERRPQVGDRVRYVPGRDGQGRPRAEHMRLDGPPTLDRPEIRQRPAAPATTRPARAKGARRRASGPLQQLPAKLLVFAALCLLPLAGSLKLGSALPLLLYVGASLVSLLLYWHDKRSAMHGQWRTPESTLHLSELLGGWPGALLAQQLFRHKTRKPGYQVLFWLIVVVHQAFWIDLLFIGSTLTRERWDWLLQLL